MVVSNGIGEQQCKEKKMFHLIPNLLIAVLIERLTQNFGKKNGRHMFKNDESTNMNMSI